MDENAICAVNIIHGEMRYITVRERRIDEAVRRVINPRSMIDLFQDSYPDGSARYLNNKEPAVRMAEWTEITTINHPVSWADQIRAEYRRIVECEEGRA